MIELAPSLYSTLPAFSPSQIDVWEECPQEWEYAYTERLKRKATVARHLDVGNYFHELCHVYYHLLKEGQSAGSDFLVSYMDSRIKRDLNMVLTSEEFDDNQKIHLASVIALVQRMMRRYIKVQSRSIDTGIVVVEVEKHVEAVFTTPQGREIILHGYVDLIYRNRTGKLRLRDHKTGANASSWHSKKIPLLSQLLIYAIIYQKMSERTIYDVEISYINSYDYKKKEPTKDEAFGLYPHEHNIAALKNAKDNILQVVDLMLDRKPYRRLNSDCSSCSYFDLCDRELRGFSSADLKRTNYEKVSRDYEFTHPKLGEKSGSTENNTTSITVREKGSDFVLGRHRIGT